MRHKAFLWALAAGIGLGFGMLSAVSANAGTLDLVKKKGFIQCGVHYGLPGFASPDSQNNWKGMDIDLCRAVAAAVFNDPKAVKFTPLSAKDRFTALASGEIDILSRNSSWTISRDVTLGLLFTGVYFYDGQGFMVKKSLGVDSALKLGGASVCTQSGTTTELNLADFFKTRNMKYQVVSFDKMDEVHKAYEQGRCDAMTADRSGLYAGRLAMANADDHVILPEVISKEPLGPVVRQGDDNWFNLVKWVQFGLVNAEEFGISSKNIDEMKKSDNPEIKRMLGVKNADGSGAGFGEAMGISGEWLAQVVKHVGNYGEIYDRNVGEGSPLKMARGLNSLWKEGGLQYAPPIR